MEIEQVGERKSRKEGKTGRKLKGMKGIEQKYSEVSLHLTYYLFFIYQILNKDLDVGEKTFKILFGTNLVTFGLDIFQLLYKDYKKDANKCLLRRSIIFQRVYEHQ